MSDTIKLPPKSKLEAALAAGKKPEDLTEDEKAEILAEVDAELENMSADDVLRAIERGELQVEYVDPPNPLDNFNDENFAKFMRGEMTWAQLEGMTMEQAYAIAEFGYSMYQQGKYRDAQKMFEGLSVGNPYDPYFHAMLGAIYTKLDQHEEAVQEFCIALELDPSDIHSLVNRGELLLQHGEFEHAMEDLRAAIEMDPEGENPASLRARALAAATANAIKALIEEKGGQVPAQPSEPTDPAADPDRNG